MVEIKTTVQNKTGLHARPAAQLVALAKTFGSKEHFQRAARLHQAGSARYRPRRRRR